MTHLRTAGCWVLGVAALWPAVAPAQVAAPPQPAAPGAAITATPLPPPVMTPRAPLPTPAAPIAGSNPGPAAPTGAPAAPGAAPQGAPATQPPGAAPGSTPASPEPAPPRYPNVWVAKGVAQLQVLDRIDARTKDLTVKVGQSVTYDALTIAVQACVVRPPDQPADAAAFLVISDSHQGEPGFRGWSLANEPWLSMLQNPIYSVWVVGCES